MGIALYGESKIRDIVIDKIFYMLNTGSTLYVHNLLGILPKR